MLGEITKAKTTLANAGELLAEIQKTIPEVAQLLSCTGNSLDDDKGILESVLGDVGKAIVIMMLVLQIAGSGGTYPIVLLPKFFQMISPILPFTYAIDLMREALSGIVWAQALKDLILYYSLPLHLF